MPIVAALVPAVIGAYQAISGGIKAHKAKEALKNAQSPVYAPDRGIQNYYTEALNRYMTSPYNSLLYSMQEKNANRGVATGVQALQQRGQAIGGVSALTQGASDNLLKAATNAQQQRSQAFSQLGQAAGAQARQTQTAFDINKEQPFQRQYALNIMQAQGANQTEQAGLRNFSGGFGAASNIYAGQNMNGIGLWGSPMSGNYGNTTSGTGISQLNTPYGNQQM